MEVLDLLADLVRINSVNPNYADGTPELACAEFIETYFRQREIEVWRQEVLPERPNILARVPGRRTDRRVIFEAHMDTVSTQGMSIAPFEPELRDGHLYGRGACDTKAGLAAMMQALASVARDAVPPPCDIVLAATVDEEFSYRGVVALCQGLQADQAAAHAPATTPPARLAIVAEPTQLQAVVASKGVLRWKIDTLGQAAHSSKPQLGRNAIVAMSQVIQALQADSQRLSLRQHPLLGCATLNIGVIAGGVQVNFVPDRCSIELDRRLLPGEKWQDVYDHYHQLMQSLMRQDGQLEIVMQPPMLTDLPLENDLRQPAIKQLLQLLSSLGLDDRPKGVPFGSDASKLAALGIPSVILGPGSIDQAHAAVEYVECQQVMQAVEVYRRIMLADW